MVSVLNTVDTGHEDMIHDAEMDYYGLRLATCSSDNSVKVFDLKNGSQSLVADLKGHDGPVWQVAWAHPKFGNILASCSYDRKVMIWKELGEWKKIYEHTSHDSSVNSVAWAPHEFGLILACGSSDGSISILTNNGDSWSTQKIPNAHTIGCNAVSWCPVIDPTFDAASHQRTGTVKRLATGGCDNLVKIWREEGDRWVEENKLEAHSDWVRDVAWAPAVGPPRAALASCSQDRRVVVWTSSDYASWKPNVLNVFDDVIWNVSWSLTGGILAVSGGDNKVSLWRENSEGQWSCISELNKGQGNLNNADQRVL
ncbi:GSCOCG00005956001-RA-CDS [Cotesia congregata]|uniref:Protein SEC13 homolog n=1 Tax=Cotesia congregata TaxID=51543 RepID=A0A8J2MT13_COTCN|nr:GSCOCG00005956001-RA-CDS [Cotesia congregata]CAG5106484.1 Similar to Sec13: Protein SEC13 homolog (Mus musculus) [Cotesia congregata]